MSVRATWSAPVAGSNAVDVTFYDSGRDQTHIRQVNALFDNGVYDSDATAIRIAEVGLGVANKMRCGAIPRMEDSA